MFDTIKIWLPIEESGLHDLYSISNKLSNPSTIIKNDSESTSVIGSLENLKVNVYQTGLSIQGSLPKFYLGDNLKTLSRGDSKRAFEKMSDLLNVPLWKSKVNRIDVAHNLI